MSKHLFAVFALLAAATLAASPAAARAQRADTLLADQQGVLFQRAAVNQVHGKSQWADPSVEKTEI